MYSSLAPTTFAQKTITTIKRVYSFLNGLRQNIEPCDSNR